mgnify:CR=1 FL=1
MKLQDSGRITLGTCYYPEHWDEAIWKDDLKRMLENGIETVRIAEFAWSKIEEREGVFDYSFFDRFLDVAEETGMKVIFCTPTATPPAWLTEKYPDALNADIDGNLYRHGGRRHYNYNSKIYRELSARITEKSAAHYAGRSCIIGWQLDNEFNCELQEYYSEADSAAFRDFLRKKYGSLSALNKAWGTVFWNQTYTEWEEVYVPRKTPKYAVNPHLYLDYVRFIADSVYSYAKIQVDILKKYIKPGDFITTNGIFGNIDYQKLSGDLLDFITYDSYPNFAYCVDRYNPGDPMKDRHWSKNLAEVRAISPVFGIMEQQSGPNGSMSMMAPAPRPGQLTLWTMQSIAHGANYVSYFRWRTSTIGTEIYWHGILDYSGRDNRRLKEVREVSKKLAKFNELSNTCYEAAVAIAKDHDNVWDAQGDLWHRKVDWASEEALFNACQNTHTPFDYCYLDHAAVDDLKKYKVIFYPHAVILNEERVKLLEDYVRQGGCLVLGCRAGYKNENGRCVTEKLPGLLRNLAGADIPEYTAVSPEFPCVMAEWDGTPLPAPIFNDLLESLDGAEIVGRYSEGYYAGAGAIVKNSFGKGSVYYFGGAFNEETAKVFLEKLAVASPYASFIDAPAACEISVRANGKDKYLFLLNYTNAEQPFELKLPAVNLYTGAEEAGKQTLEPYGTRVYRLTGC